MRMRHAWCVALLLVCGCDLFATRPPETPAHGTGFIWVPASSISTLMENFQGTLQQLDAPDYARIFVQATDSVSSGAVQYSFVPTTGLQESQQSLFVGWSVASEQAYLAKLGTVLQKGSTITVLFSNMVIDQSVTTATLTADYTISLPVNSSSIVVPSVVAGSMQLRLVLVTTQQGTKEWRIATWTDYTPQSGTPSSTWSALKALLAS